MTRKQNPILVTFLAVGMTLGGAAIAVPVAQLIGDDIGPTTSVAAPTSAPAISEPATVTARPEPATSTTEAAPTPPAGPTTSTSRGAAPTTTATVPATTTTAPATVQIDATAEIAVAAAVDNVRLELGLQALQIAPDLDAYATAQAVLMAETGSLTHGPIETLLDGWVAIGENVAVADTPAAAIDALISSPDHYELITEPAYEADGVGAARDEEGRLWVVYVFATTTMPTTTTLPDFPVETTLPPEPLPEVTTTIPEPPAVTLP